MSKKSSAKSIFSGGWDAAKAEKLASVELPTKIRCSECKKFKAQSTYSNKQLLVLKNHIALGNESNSSSIRCRKCTGAQVHELTCCICGEVKGLEGFSRAQRRDPDKARCILCVYEHVTTEPLANEDDGEDSDEEDDSDTVSNMYESHVLTMENLDQFTGSDQPDRSAADALTGYGSQIGTEEDTPVRSTENNPPEGSVWREFAQHGNNFKGGAATEFTGWDSQGNAYPRVRAPSSLAASSEYGFGSTRSHTSNNDKTSGKGRRFAKPPRSEVEKKPPPPTLSVRAEGGRQIHESDSETDEEFRTI